MLIIEQNIAGDAYQKFVTEACDICDVFTLVRTDFNKSYWHNASEAVMQIRPYRIKNISTYSWPGHVWPNGMKPKYDTYKHMLEIYKICDETREFILSQNELYAWSYPNLPEDICFFKGEECWFGGTIHEGLSFINTSERKDRLMLMDLGIEFTQIDNHEDFRLKL